MLLLKIILKPVIALLLSVARVFLQDSGCLADSLTTLKWRAVRWQHSGRLNHRSQQSSLNEARRRRMLR